MLCPIRFFEAFRDDPYGATSTDKLIGTGTLPLRSLVDAAVRAGGVGHLQRVDVHLFAKASRSTVGGLVPAGVARVEVRFENEALAKPGFVLSKLIGRVVVTSLHATLDAREDWEWGDASMRPFLACCIQPRRRLGARRDPLVPKHVCTGDVMRYHDESQRLFTCDGREEVGATMYLHPRDEDNVHIDGSALYFEAWCRHPKRCGSVCMFLGAGMADLRPLVEAAARAQGLGVRLPLSIPLYTGRGSKRVGTWHVEAGFESAAYVGSPAWLLCSCPRFS